jgi:biotin-(acetyl-CoA carboxylase) ligase
MTPQQFDRTRIESFIKDLGEEELRYLNRLIVERLKLIFQEKSTRSLSRFNLGESVRFPDHEGGVKTGRIVRLNKKTATILTTDGQNWKVSPGLLESAER